MVQADWDSGDISSQNQAVGASAAAGEPPQNGNFMNVIGAVLSLALLVGLAIWGYKLAVRDVSGVPVVRAVEGPMRIQPDDPGGESAAYQGYSVNNVQADGSAEAPADTLALAPRNVGLANGDTPASPSEVVSEVVEVIAPIAEATAEPTSEPTDVASLVDQLTDGVTPLTEDLTDITPTSSGGAQTTQDAVNDAVAQVAIAPQIIAATVPGVSHSPRPNQRPANFARRAATQAQAAEAAASIEITDAQDVSATAPIAPVNEADAAGIPTGTRLVQLGAFDSPEIARAEWNRLAIQFEDYLPGKARVVQEASSGGKVFWRLRAMGFDDLSDARRFCAVLMAGRAACIPVVTR